MLSTYMTFIKTHEKLLIVAGILVLALFLGNKYINSSADKAIAQAAAAQQDLIAVQQENLKLAADSKQQADKYAQLVSQLIYQNQSLMNQIAARTTTLVQQQAAVQALPLPEVGSRWSFLLSLPSASLTPTSGGLNITEPAARTTVQALEELPVIKMNLKDTQQIVVNKDTQIASCGDLNQKLNAQITGLNTEIVSADTACKAQINEVKATSTRSKRNWFLRGVALGGGVVAALLIHYL